MLNMFRFLLHFMVFLLGCSRPVEWDTGNTHTWTVSDFTECSATCNGGFQVRSVRCLDRDHVISFACDAEAKPAPFQFCNRVNCSTWEFDSHLYPFFGTYYFEPEDTQNATLQYKTSDLFLHIFHLTVAELDGTTITVHKTISLDGITHSVYNITAAEISINFTTENDLPFLSIMRENVMKLSGDLDDIHIAANDSIAYKQNTLYQVHGDALSPPLIDELHTFFFCDEFKVYKFRANKSIPISGPGKVFFNPADGGVAIYFATAKPSPFSSAILLLEEKIHSITDIHGSGYSTESSPIKPFTDKGMANWHHTTASPPVDAQTQTLPFETIRHPTEAPTDVYDETGSGGL